MNEDKLFNAKQLSDDEIRPSAWGQGFKHGHGRGISLYHVLECLDRAMVEPAENEGYIHRSRDDILDLFFSLIEGHDLKFKSGSELLNAIINLPIKKHWGHGERQLIEFLQDIVDDNIRWKVYLVMADTVNKLL